MRTTTDTRPRRVGRRKACDVCHLRKIKCDAKNPSCSHCVLYNTKCVYTPLARKEKQNSKRASKDFVRLEDRLSQVEARLKVGSTISSSDETTPRSEPEVGDTQLSRPNETGLNSTVDDDFSFPSSLATPTNTENRSLPELHEALPLVEAYFTHVNSAMPLFNEDRFMSIFWEWYSDSGERSSASYAAINVVLALALWESPSRKSPGDDRMMRQCIRNSQTTLNELDAQEPDLFRLQVLLGLVMLFHSGPNPRTASILIAIAVKMAHRLRLNNKRHFQFLDHDSALERHRVFWIMYVLDRDLSFRLREPFFQQEHEMDVDLPAFTAINDKAGIVLANDGNTWVNFLLCRVDLARIQAKIYDSMYSVRAGSTVEDQRTAELAELEFMLIDWRQSIPPQFQPDMVSGTMLPASARYLTTLHFVYYQSLFHVHRIYLHEEEWIRKLTDYSDRYGCGYCVPRTPDLFESPLPPTWPEDVDCARECMRLFRCVEESDLALYGTISCTYISSMIILIANKLASPEHHLLCYTETDNEMINEALDYLKRLCAIINCGSVQKLYKGCSGLNTRAIHAAAGRRLETDPCPNAVVLPWPTTPEYIEELSKPSLKGQGQVSEDHGYGLWPADFAVLVNVASIG